MEFLGIFEHAGGAGADRRSLFCFVLVPLGAEACLGDDFVGAWPRLTNFLRRVHHCADHDRGNASCDLDGGAAGNDRDTGHDHVTGTDSAFDDLDDLDDND